MRYLKLHLPTDHFILSDADGKTHLYLPATGPTPNFEEITLEDQIDWTKQWSAETIEIDLSQYGVTQKLRLIAGPGFGDLSHPTTRLTLQLMAPYIKNKDVLDIGCGSGILSLAASLMHAKTVYGLDIDPDALHHAQENASLNHLDTHFTQPKTFTNQLHNIPVILMNMIRTEQTTAWNSLPQLHQTPAIWITSGILATEKKRYLKECTLRKWTLIKEIQEDKWMGFVFRLS